MTDAARHAARLRRVEGYSQWLSDDADGIAYALAHPEPLPGATAILAEARAQVALTLSRLDRAIAADAEAHKEPAL